MTGAATVRRLADVSVLVVEDEMMMAMLLEDLLTDFGCSILGPVASVAKALLQLQHQNPDGALLDINLGSEKVYPVAEELAARNIPFVFVTGYDGPGIAEEFSGRPRLQKPVDVQGLKRMMEAVIVGHGSRPEPLRRWEPALVQAS